MFTDRDSVETVGGYSFVMTVDELNEFTRFIRKTTEYIDYRKLQAKLDYAVENGCGLNMVEQFTLELIEVERRLFDIAEQWITTNIKEEDPLR